MKLLCRHISLCKQEGFLPSAFSHRSTTITTCPGFPPFKTHLPPADQIAGSAVLRYPWRRYRHKKNDTQIVFQTVVGSVRLCTFDPAYIISVYTDTVTVCPLRILGVKSIRKMKSNAIVLLCTPKIFCIYPDGGIRALLEILMFKWEIKYGNMSLLIAFFTAVI